MVASIIFGSSKESREKSNKMVNRVYGRRSERQRKKQLRRFSNEPDNPLVIEDEVESIDNDIDEENNNIVEDDTQEHDQAAEENLDDEGDNNEEESNVGLQKQ
ncbi:hypothetical protein L1887_11268 [Cichorium endivia]|nr:hypothetical protein L1887_11268 [Cichorium endivia]